MPDIDITSPAIDRYLNSLLPKRDEIFREMEEQATRSGLPIIGPAVGRLLHQLVLMTGARRIFEMGSGIGYSTLWLASATGNAGRVIFTDGDRRNATDARAYLQRAGLLNRVDVRVGDALEVLSEEKGPFDLIFNDVDKEDYPRVLRLVLPRLRQGGLFVSDNTLWHGRVLDPRSNDLETRAIAEFNRTLYASEQFYTTILPLRDGVSVAMKL